jgi:membrane associated rhomboid family serine protease
MDDLADAPAPAQVPEPTSSTPVTYAVIGLCVAIFLLFNTWKQMPAQVADALAPSATLVWHGAVWGLATCAFVHVAVWHLLFNMMWARDFGRALEPDLGALRYLGLILLTAVVSSGWQLLVSGQTGIGYSGVLYALFGYLVARRGSHPAYAAVVNRRTIQWLLGWLVLCVVLTFTGTWSVGNGAHVAGLASGWLIGFALERPPRRWLALAAGAVMAAGVLLACFYMPWSEQWQSRDWLRGFELQRRKAEAGDPPSQAAHGATLMSRAEGLEWLRRSAKSGDLEGMNDLAWFLAVAREDRLRNGAEAVTWAERARERKATAQVTDTLAAAYAEADRWEEAITTQEAAIAKLTNEDPAPYLDHLESYRRHQKWRE